MITKLNRWYDGLGEGWRMGVMLLVVTPAVAGVHAAMEFMNVGLLLISLGWLILALGIRTRYLYHS